MNEGYISYEDTTRVVINTYKNKYVSFWDLLHACSNLVNVSINLKHLSHACSNYFRFSVLIVHIYEKNYSFLACSVHTQCTILVCLKFQQKS
jgi:hypothetical protein